MNQYEQAIAQLMSRGYDRTQAEQVYNRLLRAAGPTGSSSYSSPARQDFLKDFTQRSSEQTSKAFMNLDDVKKRMAEGYENLKGQTKKAADQATKAAQKVNPQGKTAKLAGRAAPILYGAGSLVQGDLPRAGGEVVGGLSGQFLTQRAVQNLPIPGWAKVALAVGGSALGTGLGGTAASNIAQGFGLGGGNPNIPQTQTAKSVELPFGLGTYAFNEAARQDKRREQQFQQQLRETERMKKLDLELQKELLQATNQSTMQFNYQMSPLIERSKDLDRNRTAQLMNQQYGIDAGLTLLQNQGSLARQGMAASAQILSSMATSNPYAAALR